MNLDYHSSDAKMTTIDNLNDLLQRISCIKQHIKVNILVHFYLYEVSYTKKKNKQIDIFDKFKF